MAKSSRRKRRGEPHANPAPAWYDKFGQKGDYSALTLEDIAAACSYALRFRSSLNLARMASRIPSLEAELQAKRMSHGDYILRLPRAYQVLEIAAEERKEHFTIPHPAEAIACATTDRDDLYCTGAYENCKGVLHQLYRILRREIALTTKAKSKVGKLSATHAEARLDADKLAGARPLTKKQTIEAIQELIRILKRLAAPLVLPERDTKLWDEALVEGKAEHEKWMLARRSQMIARPTRSDLRILTAAQAQARNAQAKKDLAAAAESHAAVIYDQKDKAWAEKVRKGDERYVEDMQHFDHVLARVRKDVERLSDIDRKKNPWAYQPLVKLIDEDFGGWLVRVLDTNSWRQWWRPKAPVLIHDLTCITAKLQNEPQKEDEIRDNLEAADHALTKKLRARQEREQAVRDATIKLAEDREGKQNPRELAGLLLALADGYEDMSRPGADVEAGDRDAAYAWAESCKRLASEVRTVNLHFVVRGMDAPAKLVVSDFGWVEGEALGYALAISRGEGTPEERKLKLFLAKSAYRDSAHRLRDMADAVLDEQRLLRSMGGGADEAPPPSSNLARVLLAIAREVNQQTRLAVQDGQTVERAESKGGQGRVGLVDAIEEAEGHAAGESTQAADDPNAEYADAGAGVDEWFRRLVEYQSDPKLDTGEDAGAAWARTRGVRLPSRWGSPVKCLVDAFRRFYVVLGHATECDRVERERGKQRAVDAVHEERCIGGFRRIVGVLECAAVERGLDAPGFTRGALLFVRHPNELERLDRQCWAEGDLQMARASGAAGTAVPGPRFTAERSPKPGAGDAAAMERAFDLVVGLARRQASDQGLTRPDEPRTKTKRRRKSLVRKPKDGPHPPNLLRWKGKEHPMAPLQWRILEYMWSKDSVQQGEFEEKIWEEEFVPRSTIQSALSKLNSWLLGLDPDLGTFHVKNGFVCRERPKT